MFNDRDSYMTTFFILLDMLLIVIIGVLTVLIWIQSLPCKTERQYYVTYKCVEYSEYDGESVCIQEEPIYHYFYNDCSNLQENIYE